MSSIASSSSSHWLRWMSNSMVREALLTSVACTAPPVSCQVSQESTVPKASSPRPAASRAPGELSSIHASLVPEKIGVDDQPGLVAHHRFAAALLQRLAGRRGAPVLPDYGVAQRLAALADSRPAWFRAGW
jgi:hypothetical protein